MNSNYPYDRNASEQRDVGNSYESSHISSNQNRQHSYGRDNASMRGNDFYGTQSYNSDYNRGAYSTSTYGTGRSRQGGYAARNTGSMEKHYVEFPDYSNRPTYGSYAGSRAYTNFINHNYGYARSEAGNTGEDKSQPGAAERKSGTAGTGTRTPFRSENQSRYSENDGRRR
ncbi:hypothetical protein [Pontibacter litorisediminis]|uniref:hypothetical protein n=1 Tax=Pontibacter litorisediminis TaxID=1846260 RepID=UPI0023EC9DB1|nr:hypothetical protein [Pontibacter litorisediminis]